MSMRIPVGLRDQMIEDMEVSNDYNNLNQWIQQAIREFLLKRKSQRQDQGGNRTRPWDLFSGMLCRGANR